MAQTTETPAKVADLATETADIPARGLLLLGIAGDDDARRALFRLPDGSTEVVTRGDTVDGATVAAIDEESVILARGNRTERVDLL